MIRRPGVLKISMARLAEAFYEMLVKCGKAGPEED
jgi:hypothetical protein